MQKFSPETKINQDFYNKYSYSTFLRIQTAAHLEDAIKAPPPNVIESISKIFKAQKITFTCGALGEILETTGKLFKFAELDMMSNARENDQVWLVQAGQLGEDFYKKFEEVAAGVTMSYITKCSFPEYEYEEHKSGSPRGLDNEFESFTAALEK